MATPQSPNEDAELDEIIDAVIFASVGTSSNKSQREARVKAKAAIKALYARPTITLEELKANESIGWYEDGGLVVQVVTTKPRKLRFIGILEGSFSSSARDDARPTQEWCDQHDVWRTDCAEEHWDTQPSTRQITVTAPPGFDAARVNNQSSQEFGQRTKLAQSAVNEPETRSTGAPPAVEDGELLEHFEHLLDSYADQRDKLYGQPKRIQSARKRVAGQMLACSAAKFDEVQKAFNESGAK